MVKRAQQGEPETIWRDVPEYDLVRMTKLGNASAFGELVARTSDVCLRVATCILKSREDAG